MTLPRPPLLFSASLLAMAPLAGFDADEIAPVAINLPAVDYFQSPIFADACKNMAVSGSGVWQYREDGGSNKTVLFHDSPLLDGRGYPRPAASGDLYESWLNAVDDGATGLENTAFIGRLVLEWKGTADVSLRNLDNYLVGAESSPAGTVKDGRRVYALTARENLTLELTDFDLADPITEIDLWLPMPDRPETPATDERFAYSCLPAERAAYNATFGLTEHPDAFHFFPPFLAPLRDRQWDNLRMMVAAETNNNPTMHWSERNLPDQFSQADVRSYRDPYTGAIAPAPTERHSGIAWEYQVAMANATGLDLWICVPHLAVAGGNHVTKIAQLVRYGSDGVEPYTSDQGANAAWPGLDPSLSLYIEYSNEIWNGGGQFQGFDQYHWIKARGEALGRSLPEQAAHEYRQVFNDFDAVWAGALNRRARVIAWDAPVDYYFDTLGGSCELFARTWYFENGMVDYLTFDLLGAVKKGSPFIDGEFAPETALNTNANTLTEADAGEGWHLPDSASWSLNGGDQALEVVGDGSLTVFGQVMADNGWTVGERTVQLRFTNREGDAAENRLRFQIFGSHTPFSLSNVDAASPVGVDELYASGDLATGNVTNRTESVTVDFGENGYAYLALRIVAEQVDPAAGDALAVSRVFMTQSIEYPADVAERFSETFYDAAFAEWKRRMLSDISTVFGDEAWSRGDSFYGNGILEKSRERAIPATTYEAAAATASWQYDGGGTADDWVTEFFNALYTQPGADELYRLQLEKSKSAGIRGFHLFHLFGAWNKWGQWGHVRNQFADFENDSGALRYRAVRAFHDEHQAIAFPDLVTNSRPEFSTSEVLPPATLNEIYQGIALKHASGEGSVSLSIVASVLTDGLSLDRTSGRITGTPTSSEPSYLYARVTDADGDSSWQRFLLRVMAPQTADTVAIDFEDIAPNPSGVTEIEVSGYTFTSDNPDNSNVKPASPDWTGWPRKWTSHVLWITAHQAIMLAPEGLAFDLNALEIGSNAALSMLVEGFVDGNRVIDTVINLDDSDPSGNANRMTPFNFDDAWRNLDEVRITPYKEPDLGGGSWVGVGIDNVLLNQPRKTSPPEAQSLAPVLLKDAYVLAAPDGFYYLTGTVSRGDDGDFDHNEGVRLWRSSDTLTWSDLGLVWDMTTAGRNATTSKEWNVPGGRISGYPAHGMSAPEIHFAKGTYWILYSLNGQGTGLLKSSSGLPEGPYEDIGLITTRGDDPTLLVDGSEVYWLYSAGWIARMNADMTGLVERPSRLPLIGNGSPGSEAHRVEHSGVSVFQREGLFHLVTHELRAVDGMASDDAVIWISDQPTGPYWRTGIVLADTGPLNAFTDGAGTWFAAFSDPDSHLPMIAELPVNADLDGDRLPDWWEMRHGSQGPISLFVDANTDGDALDGLGEYLFRRDPNVPDLAPISTFSPTPGHYVFRARFAPDSRIPVSFETSSNLREWFSMDPLDYDIEPDGDFEDHEITFEVDDDAAVFIRMRAE